MHEFPPRWIGYSKQQIAFVSFQVTAAGFEVTADSVEVSATFLSNGAITCQLPDPTASYQIEVSIVVSIWSTPIIVLNYDTDCLTCDFDSTLCDYLVCVSHTKFSSPSRLRKFVVSIMQSRWCNFISELKSSF